jgi:PAS domain S-box-containing protein
VSQAAPDIIKRSYLSSNRLVIALIGILVTIIMAAIYIWQPTFLVFLNYKTYDALLRFVGPANPSHQISIVTIDEKSVARYGQWPWPHYRLARLLDTINELGAKTVAVDFLLSERDRTSLATIQKEMARELGVKVEFGGTDSEHMDNDRLLAEALQKGSFVLGIKFAFDPAAPGIKNECFLKPLTVIQRAPASNPSARNFCFQAGGVICTIPVLAKKAKRQGFLNVGVDSDGVLRRAPLLIKYQGQYYPSLALATYLQMHGLNQVLVHLSELGAQAVQVRDNLIPVDARARLLINYRGSAKAFRIVSAEKILEGQAPKEAIAGKVVVVGISAAGLKDLLATPLAADSTGVVIQANLLDNLIQRDYLSSPAYSPGLEMGLILVCGLVSAWLLTRLRALGNLVLLGGGAMLVFGLAAWSLKQNGLYWSPLWPLLTLAANFSLLNLARFRQEENQVKSRTLELANTVQALRKEVSERELAEKALAISEERFRVLSEESPLGISVVGENGKYEYLNPTFEEMFGYTLADFANGKEWFRLAFPDPDYRHEVIAAWKDGLARKQNPKSKLHTFEVTCKDDTIKTILFRPVTIPNGKQFILYEDITDRIMAEREMRLLEEKLYQSQKMEALGVLAGGIAHDFNNVLQAISGYVQLMLAARDNSHISTERLQKVAQSADRAAGMIRQLMTMARKVETRSEKVNLNQEVGQTVEVLEHTLPRMISISTNLEPGLRNISGDPGQVEQVLLNLATNAWHAMPKGGKLTFLTRNVALTPEDCKTLVGLQPGDYVKLEISDTGQGMAEDVKVHIFEPFFTTKPSGKGTGLGLSTVYGIITNHDGQIYCHSKPNQGTTFSLYFPAMTARDQLMSEQASHPAKPLGGDETILVVDDEEVILDSCREALEGVGYRVLTANSGEMALEIYEQDPKDVDLVIMDLNMPGMGGLKCLEAIKAANPKAKVVVATGYADQEVEGRINSLGGDYLIGKPYRFVDLMASVRKVLDK